MTRNTVEESIVPFGPTMAGLWDRVVHPLVAQPIETLERGFIKGHLGRLHDRGQMLDVGCGEGAGRSPRRSGRLRRGVGHGAPIQECTFDLMTSFGALELWPDRAKGLAECTRVLKTGGRLVVLEAERACKLENARAFLHDLGVPTVLEPLLITLVRTWAGALSLTSDEAQAIASNLPLTELTVTQLPCKPFFVIEGRKAPPPDPMPGEGEANVSCALRLPTLRLPVGSTHDRTLSNRARARSHTRSARTAVEATAIGTAHHAATRVRHVRRDRPNLDRGATIG